MSSKPRPSSFERGFLSLCPQLTSSPFIPLFCPIHHWATALHFWLALGSSWLVIQLRLDIYWTPCKYTSLLIIENEKRKISCLVATVEMSIFSLDDMVASRHVIKHLVSDFLTAFRSGKERGVGRAR